MRTDQLTWANILQSYGLYVLFSSPGYYGKSPVLLEMGRPHLGGCHSTGYRPGSWVPAAASSALAGGRLELSGVHDPVCPSSRMLRSSLSHCPLRPGVVRLEETSFTQSMMGSCCQLPQIKYSWMSRCRRLEEKLVGV